MVSVHLSCASRCSRLATPAPHTFSAQLYLPSFVHARGSSSSAAEAPIFGA